MLRALTMKITFKYIIDKVKHGIFTGGKTIQIFKFANRNSIPDGILFDASNPYFDTGTTLETYMSHYNVQIGEVELLYNLV